jgi:hypothetical protein
MTEMKLLHLPWLKMSVWISVPRDFHVSELFFKIIFNLRNFSRIFQKTLHLDDIVPGTQ